MAEGIRFLTRQDFAVYVGKLGITPATSVVVYDDKNGANAAARFWWMLRALGHEKVQVVDGGLEAIIRQGLPMTSGHQQPLRKSPYPAEGWKLPTVNIEDVQAAAKDPDSLIIDVREAYRYRGEKEPIDLVAGPYSGCHQCSLMLIISPKMAAFALLDELASQYQDVLGARDPSNVIVHCGSGVTACHTLLALEQAGIKGANLYVGSWSEWSRTRFARGHGGILDFRL